jgi:hypothetical protein
MIRRLAILACFLVGVFFASDGRADLRADIARCTAIADDAARLACYDGIELPLAPQTTGTLDESRRRELEEALDREFRFDPQLRTGTFNFRLAVSGDLQISRDTAAAREVERLVRRLAKVFGDFADWGVAVTVHGAQVALSRGKPYTGEELLQQAAAGLERSGLARGRYTAELGKPAQPRLWDDGRIRGANEHIDVVVNGLD